MKTIQLTDEQYQALCEGKPVTLQPPSAKTNKWGPKGGTWSVLSKGKVAVYTSYTPTREFGVEYPTKEAAEKARDAMRTHNRLLAWLSENDDGWVADWSDSIDCKYYVLYHNTNKKYYIKYDNNQQYLGTVYMSEANAEKLCKLLNQGVVEL